MTIPPVSLIIPAFNEEKSIGGVLEGLQKLYPEMDILVIDDGSTDETARAVQQRAIPLFRHSERGGYGSSLKTGLRHSQGEIVVFFDGDGQHDPRDVARLLDAMKNADMVVGARSPLSDSFSRRLAKKILSFFVNRAAGQKIPDFNSGLRALRREKALPLLPFLPDGFSLTTTITLLFFQKGYRVDYLPIEIHPTSSPSKVRARDFFKTLFLILKFMVKKSPHPPFSKGGKEELKRCVSSRSPIFFERR